MGAGKEEEDEEEGEEEGRGEGREHTPQASSHFLGV